MIYMWIILVYLGIEFLTIWVNGIDHPGRCARSRRLSVGCRRSTDEDLLANENLGTATGRSRRLAIAHVRRNAIGVTRDTLWVKFPHSDGVIAFAVTGLPPLPAEIPTFRHYLPRWHAEWVLASHFPAGTIYRMKMKWKTHSPPQPHVGW